MILTIAAERDHWKREAEALRAQIEGLTVERDHYRKAHAHLASLVHHCACGSEMPAKLCEGCASALRAERDELLAALRGAIRGMDTEDEGACYEALDHARRLLGVEHG